MGGGGYDERGGEGVQREVGGCAERGGKDAERGGKGVQREVGGCVERGGRV